MKRIFKLLIVLILLTSIITGCDKKEFETTVESDEVFLKYLNLLENYEPRTKTDSNIDNPEFEIFLNEIFKETLEENYIFYHFNIENPDLLDVKKPEVSLGEIKFDTRDELEELLEDLNELEEFDFDTLSRRQQIDFEAFEYSIYESVLQLVYSKYESPFTQGNDIVGNLLTNFSEFKFRSDQDVSDYFLLLADFDRYLNDAISYSKVQFDNGVKLSDHSIDEALNYLDSVLANEEEFVLIKEFENNLNEYGLYDDQEAAIVKNKEIIDNEVIPSLIDLKSYLLANKQGVQVDELAICNLNRDYAKAKYYIETSSNFSIDELFSQTEQFLLKSFDNYVEGLYDEPSYNEYLEALNGSFEPFNLGYEDTLYYLREHTKEAYKDLGDIEFSISPLDKSSAQNSILAYYMASPVDNFQQNVIRVNENTLGDDFPQTYTTLAHEGFPGHLFQNAYSIMSGTSNFRTVLNFIGYSEGYGVYAQNLALNLANFKEIYTKDIIEFIDSYYFTLYSLMDIGINYYGWDRKEFKSFLDKVGLFDKSTYDDMCDVFFEVFTDMPGTYCSYGVGYVNFMTLKNKAIEELGDKFSESDFNDAILKDGDLPFVMVKQNVLDYIDHNK